MVSELETLRERRAGRVREASVRSREVFSLALALNARWQAEAESESPETREAPPRVSGQFLADCDDAAAALWHPGPRHPMLLEAEERRGAAEAVLDYVAGVSGVSAAEVMAPDALLAARAGVSRIRTRTSPLLRIRRAPGSAPR